MTFNAFALQVGDRVRIIKGALFGLEGIVLEFGTGGRPIVNVDGLFKVMVGLSVVERTVLKPVLHTLN